MAERLALPTPKVESIPVAGVADTTSTAVSALHDTSMLALFWEADILVKTVLLLLIGASFWSWAIIFEKLPRFSRILKEIETLSQALWSGESVDTLYDRVRRHAVAPAARVLVAGMETWSEYRSRLASALPRPVIPGRTRAPEETQDDRLRDRLSRVLYLACDREMAAVERGLGFLATVGATAPFVGLLGTVWGIMNSFQSIAATKNTTLAVVAPGIAEALLATAIGLFAAIPAVIFYNRFTYAVSDVARKLELFSETLLDALCEPAQAANEESHGQGGTSRRTA